MYGRAGVAPGRATSKRLHLEAIAGLQIEAAAANRRSPRAETAERNGTGNAAAVVLRSYHGNCWRWRKVDLLIVLMERETDADADDDKDEGLRKDRRMNGGW